MLKIILSIALGYTIPQCNAQNIVLNASFEDTVSCPYSNSQIYFSNYWFQPNQYINITTASSTDYFNSCATPISGVSVPNNDLGTQNARTGNAYAGFILYMPSFVNGREYIEGQLSQPLKAGMTYCVKFYVSAGRSKYGIDFIGIYFDKDSILYTSSNYYNLPFTPQVENKSGNYITDTVGWIPIQGSFVASGGEKFFVIGNFRTDVNTGDTLYNPTSINSYAYYYIDDISVIECDTTDNNSVIMVVPNIFTPNYDGTNDVFFITSKNIKILNCKIYNRWGLLVGELKNLNDSWDGRTTAGEECTDGVYYYVLTAIGLDEKEYKEKGFVQLVR